MGRERIKTVEGETLKMIIMKWDNLRNTMEDYRKFLETATKDNIKHYELSNKIYFTLQVNDTLFEIEFNAPGYWKYANYGRSPGKFPPPDKIEDWIVRRKISPYPTKSGKTPTRKQLTYLISRKIAREGFEGSGFLEKSLSEQQDYWEDRIKEAISEDIELQIMEWLSPFRGETII